MFPAYIVVLTKHTPATPQTNETNQALSYAPANTLAEAESIAAEQLAKKRAEQGTTGYFGSGMVIYQVAIYSPFKGPSGNGSKG